MISNRTIFLITLLAIVMIITVPTIIRINDTHTERLLKVETLKIKEKALLCEVKGECKEEKITLKYLIDNKYLTRGIDPRTKEYFKDDVYVILKDGKATLFIDGIETD